MVRRLAVDLRAEATATNQRRLLVLTGQHPACLTTTTDALLAADIPTDDAVLVGHPEPNNTSIPTVTPGSLLGTTHPAVVFDAHPALDPTRLARAVGTVDGGGLFLLCCPALNAWPDHRDQFDESITVHPHTPDEVTSHFRRWFIDTLRAHPGIAIYDTDAERVLRDGLTNQPAPPSTARVTTPPTIRFPRTAYDHCRTQDQADALAALETLDDPPRAVVLESDRGRGKSYAVGLAAACYAHRGDHVTVTAPTFENARETFDSANHLLDTLGATPDQPDPHTITPSGDGLIEYTPPGELTPDHADVLLVDEAAGISVQVLNACLTNPRVAFATTIHGYEGAGRGFTVRFKDRLAASDHTITEVTLTEPIRYAPGDPVEIWSFRAFLLDARPAVDQIVANAHPDTVEYETFTPATLIANEHLLRETFGLLVLAHYRTEPADLVRLLDAPNLTVRALTQDGHVVSVALLAREGRLPVRLRANLYDGGRIRGHMIPDILTSQLRDEQAGTTRGLRIMRIATHQRVRSRGLGSHLLTMIHREFADDTDWFGTGYGALPDLVSFWADNDYAAVHLSITRNRASGEHSTVMLNPTSPAGQALHDRHAAWFANRVTGMLTDPLADLEPDVTRAVLRSVNTTYHPTLTDADWRHIASMAFGPGLFDIDPDPYRALAVAYFLDPDRPTLEPHAERLLVRKALQAHPWPATADDLGYDSVRECRRALGRTYQPLVTRYGPPAALAERDRFTPDE